MSTIRDVAKLSGVSIATVSHVLNNRSSKVGLDTRERVLAAVRELRYRPTALEDRQKATRTNNLGFLVQDLSVNPVTTNLYFGAVLNGVIETAALRGYSTTITVETMWDDVGHSIRRSYDGHCDGVILLAPNANSVALHTLWERGMNLVCAGATCGLPGVSTVDIDNVATGAEGTKYLLGLGHRKIGFVGGSMDTVSVLERCRGYLLAMADAGMPSENVCVALPRGDDDAWRALPTAREALGRGVPYLERVFEFVGHEAAVILPLVQDLMPDATAALTWNDGVGRRSVDALKTVGIHVPGQFSILSVDDSGDAVSEHPYLTTYHQPMHLIGKTAVNMLLERIEDHTYPEQTLRFMPELIVRESAAPH